MKKFRNEKWAYADVMTPSTSGNLLDLAYFKQNYKLIATDLSKQAKLKDSQQLISLVNLKIKLMKQKCFLSSKNLKKQL